MPSSKKAAKKAAKRAKAEEASKKRALARASARAAAKSSKDKKNGNLGDKLRFLTYNSDDAIDQLHQSARYGEVSTVVAILDQGLADVDVTGEYEGKPATALLLAATGRQPGTTAALLRAGADPKFRTTDGPILHLAAAIPDNVEVLKILTAHPDIDVGECCPMGRSPLSWATRFGDVENVKALLDYCKADIHLKDDADGGTAVMQAADYGRLDALKALLKRGANPNDSIRCSGRGDSGKRYTCLFMACVNGGSLEVLEELVRAGAKVDVEGCWSALSGAAHKGDARAVQFLIKAGAKVDERGGGKEGWTSLMCGAWNGQVDTVRALIEAGADLDKRSKDNGSTALHIAARYGHAEVVKILVGAGADIEKKEKGRDEITPLFASILGGNPECSRLLTEAGACHANVAKKVAIKLGKSRAAKAMEAALKDKDKEKEKTAKFMRRKKKEEKGKKEGVDSGNFLGVLYSFFLFIYTLLINFLSARNRLNQEELGVAFGKGRGAHNKSRAGVDDIEDIKDGEDDQDDEDEYVEDDEDEKAHGIDQRSSSSFTKRRARGHEWTMLHEEEKEDVWLPRQRRGIFT